MPESTAADPATAADNTRPAFDLVVDAPADLRELLEHHLDIQRFRTLPDLSEEELSQLVTALPAQARSLLGARGYFSPVIRAQIAVPEANGSATEHVAPQTISMTPPVPRVHVQVDPGPVSHVASVNISLRGPVDEAVRQTLAELLRGNWLLPVGQAFSQRLWDDAKADALAQLTRHRYPAATPNTTLADVDGDAHAVHLYLELDTGEPFTFGPLETEGLAHYEPEWVTRTARLAGWSPGEPYSLATLQAVQQRLAQTGYFDSVFVYVDPTGPANPAPVVVKVREARRGKLLLGVGGSTDNGPRLSAEYTLLRIPGTDWRAQTQLRLERDNRVGQAEVSSPPDETGWRWIVGGKAERVVDNGTTATNQQVSLGRAHDTERLTRRYTLQVDQSLTRTASTPDAAVPDRAISLHHTWHLREHDQLPFPTTALGLTTEVGAGFTLQPTRSPYLRARVRWQRLHSLGSAAAGRVLMRAEGGAVWASHPDSVPDAQQFVTGGDQSVRGYAARSIGITQADGSVTAGRLLTAGSLEWQRPWLRDGVPTAWETALFLDGGSVANRVVDLRAHWGVGGGLRYNTPVGPIQFDLAYGVATRRWRLHMSVGFVF